MVDLEDFVQRCGQGAAQNCSGEFLQNIEKKLVELAEKSQAEVPPAKVYILPLWQNFSSHFPIRIIKRHVYDKPLPLIVREATAILFWPIPCHHNTQQECDFECTQYFPQEHRGGGANLLPSRNTRFFMNK